ncbi:MAG: hypothetical protein AAF066_06570, partial [Pseudomonadota bacterium]
MLECGIDDLELRPGGVVGVAGADKEVSFHQISLRAHWAAGGPIVGHNTWVFNQPSVDPKRAVAKGLPFPQIGVYSFACIVDLGDRFFVCFIKADKMVGLNPVSPQHIPQPIRNGG